MRYKVEVLMGDHSWKIWAQTRLQADADVVAEAFRAKGGTARVRPL